MKIEKTILKLFGFNLERKNMVNIQKINIPIIFLLHSPKASKLKSKENMASKYGMNILPTINVDKNFNLIDGYCTYLIYKKRGAKKVPVKIQK